MSKLTPRYIEIAQKIETDIQQGLYVVGDLLETEATLCKTHHISRFTARNALNILEDRGLIQRVQGKGSVVVSLQTSMFKDTWSSIDELLAHAGSVNMVFESIEDVVVDDILSAKLGFSIGKQLVQISGIRFQSKDDQTSPICTIKIWIPARFRSVVDGIDGIKGSIAYLLEQEFSIKSTHVDQDISACLIDKTTASKLNVREGEPALHLVRKFLDDRNTIFEVSESILPAKRFTYNMRLRRS